MSTAREKLVEALISTGVRVNSRHDDPPPYDEDDEASIIKPVRSPLDWAALEGLPLPLREWLDEHWLGKGHTTLLSGNGGIGKSSLAQAWGSCLALGRSYLDWVAKPCRVLMWACEDDRDELWRKQSAIATGLGVSLSDFAGKFIIESYDSRQVELAAQLNGGQLVGTPQLKELREQIGDYKADVVILDNIARLFAGNENDRHQVTSFIAMLTEAAQPTNAGILLLGHPAKALGSEYSGSTAWEGAVRARLYLGSKLPDSPDNDPDSPPEDDARYLCRRKANYSAKDWRRIRYVNGVMVPDAPESSGKPMSANPEYAADVVIRAVRKLATMDMHGVASKGSPNYLPKLAKHYKLSDTLTDRQFAALCEALECPGLS
ncbi:MAG: AAA family ATPase, partial [Gammaproteobacteria bacterium]